MSPTPLEYVIVNKDGITLTLDLQEVAELLNRMFFTQTVNLFDSARLEMYQDDELRAEVDADAVFIYFHRLSKYRL